MSALCRHYHWDHDFWRRMGRRQFYLWVEQASIEAGRAQEDPDSWKNTENNRWWQAARERRRRLQGH